MAAKAILIVLCLAVGLGIYLGMLYLRGERRPKLIGYHLILGATTIEGTLVLIHGAPNGEIMLATDIGTIAAGLFAASLLTGFIGPLLARRSRSQAEVVLVTHVGVGLAGFAAFLMWMTRQ